QVTAHWLEIAAARLPARHGEFRTVRLVISNVRSSVLRNGRGIGTCSEGPGAPDMLEPREDRVCPGRWVRIGNLGPVEADGFATIHERRRDDYPLGGITVFKVRSEEHTSELQSLRH